MSKIIFPVYTRELYMYPDWLSYNTSRARWRTQAIIERKELVKFWNILNLQILSFISYEKI